MGFLDGLDEEYAPSWKPDPGDTADGVITRINKRDGKWGPYAVITIRRITNEQLTPDEIAVHMQGKVLEGWVDQEQPAKGDRFAIRYNGQKTGKDSGIQYRDYSRTLARAAELEPKFRLDSFGLDKPAAAPAVDAPAAPQPVAAPAAGGDPW